MTVLKVGINDVDWPRPTKGILDSKAPCDLITGVMRRPNVALRRDRSARTARTWPSVAVPSTVMPTPGWSSPRLSEVATRAATSTQRQIANGLRHHNATIPCGVVGLDDPWDTRMVSHPVDMHDFDRALGVLRFKLWICRAAEDARPRAAPAQDHR